MNKILHLGLGNFHKAHQAWYVEKLNQQLPPKDQWEICAFSMQRPDAAQEMLQKNCRYDVLELEGADQETTTITCIKRVGFVAHDRELLKQLACDPAMTLVTLTVTEKGYAPDGVALRTLETILSERTRIAAPLSILSCDNLQGNGHKLEALVRALMGKNFPQYPVSFPSAMVDRIVPASPPGAPVKTERFTQWVIEDRFVAPRPAFETVGVEFVSSVVPWELMKLRLLNAGHSFLAYHGLNRGMEFVHEAVNDKETRVRLLELWDEIIPHLTLPSGFDARAYTNRLLTRFNNPLLPHKLAQIATDGSVKLPQRIVPTLRLARKKNAPHVRLDMVLEEWTTAMRDLPESLFRDPLRPIRDAATLLAHVTAQDL